MAFEQGIEHALQRGRALEATALHAVHQPRVKSDHHLRLARQLVQRRIHGGRGNRERTQGLVRHVGGRLGKRGRRRQRARNHADSGGHGERTEAPRGRSGHLRQATGGHGESFHESCHTRFTESASQSWGATVNQDGPSRQTRNALRKKV
ncbi:hypothetical protein D3C86_1750290 [compost metagenome]